jgi:hypothetical protein
MGKEKYLPKNVAELNLTDTLADVVGSAYKAAVEAGDHIVGIRYFFWALSEGQVANWVQPRSLPGGEISSARLLQIAQDHTMGRSQRSPDLQREVTFDDDVLKAIREAGQFSSTPEIDTEHVLLNLVAMQIASSYKGSLDFLKDEGVHLGMFITQVEAASRGISTIK